MSGPMSSRLSLKALALAALLSMPAAALAQSEAQKLDLTTPMPRVTQGVDAPSTTSGDALPAGPYTVEQCVEIAVRASGKVAEAEGLVSEWKARLYEVEANIYPKLQGLALAAPMFTVEAKDGADVLGGVKRKWKSISDWGPYFRLELLLVQPIFTFGLVWPRPQRPAPWRLVELWNDVRSE